MNGVLSPSGERWQLRYERSLSHPPERVWRALTSEADLRAWFPSAVEGEFAAGEPLRFVFADQPAIPSGEGEVLRCEPPVALEFTWFGDSLLFELAPRDDGTALTLTVTFDELGKAARDGAGWHECLDLLGAVLDGEPGWQLGARWRELAASYVAALGPDASTVGPPDGWEEPA